jgi:hypothetical protein
MIQWMITFTFVLFTWIFFRSQTVDDAIYIVFKIFEDIFSLNILRNIWYNVRATQIGIVALATTTFSIIIMELNHYLEEKSKMNYFTFLELKLKSKIIPIYLLILWIIIAGSIFSSASEFIYFQF